MKQFTCPKAVTHLSINRARCRSRPTRYRYTKPPTCTLTVANKTTKSQNTLGMSQLFSPNWNSIYDNIVEIWAAWLFASTVSRPVQILVSGCRPDSSTMNDHRLSIVVRMSSSPAVSAAGLRRPAGQWYFSSRSPLPTTEKPMRRLPFVYVLI